MIEGYLISLVLTLLIALGSLVPGMIDARLGDELTRAARERISPTVTVTTHVEGDPLLQLPWGVVPHLTVRLAGLKVREMPISEVRLELDNVNVGPGAVLGGQKPRLAGPVAARLAVRIARLDLQARLERELAGLDPRRMAFELPILGRVTPVLQEVRMGLSEGRVSLTGQVQLKPGAEPRPFVASLALAVQDGRRLVAIDPRLSLAGRALPSFLLAPLAGNIPPLFDLRELPLPVDGWQLVAPALDGQWLEVRAAGSLATLDGTPLKHW